MTSRLDDLLPVQVLVFNVSHVDVLLDVTRALSLEPHIARPKFNRFYPLSLKLQNAVTEMTDLLYTETFEERGSINSDAMVPVGFCLRDSPVTGESWGSFHLKDQIVATNEEMPLVSAVYFPLISQILFTWNRIDKMTQVKHRKVVMLLSGAGTPRDPNVDIFSNSTKRAAELISLFISRCYPGTETICLDSGLGVFHYDKNIQYCSDTVLPAVEAIRHPLVSRYGNEWRNNLQITISLTDGSPARLAAVSAALRIFRPNYLHMWQLKTFWFERKFFDGDLQYESFDSMETRPAVLVEDLQPQIALLVEEIIQHKLNFEAQRDSGNVSELESFWLRKTKKVVLSVLMVQKPNENTPRFFRGMNLEVSMPTGSLCSERNVIGTALASDQSLTRKDLCSIAVLSMTLNPHQSPKASSRKMMLSSSPPASASRRPRMSSNTSLNAYEKFEGELNPISPCGACLEWLKKIAEVNPAFKVVTFPNSKCEEAFVSEIA